MEVSGSTAKRPIRGHAQPVVQRFGSKTNEKRKQHSAPADTGTKRRGELVEMMFMVRASQEGLGVAKPYGDSRRYDFILDAGTRLWRVQVKSSAYRTRDRYRLSATGSNHHSRHVYTPEEIDFLIAYVVPRNVWYVIPVTQLRAKNLNLYPEDRTSRGRYEKYREAWHQLGSPEG